MLSCLLEDGFDYNSVHQKIYNLFQAFLYKLIFFDVKNHILKYLKNNFINKNDHTSHLS